MVGDTTVRILGKSIPIGAFTITHRIRKGAFAKALSFFHVRDFKLWGAAIHPVTFLIVLAYNGVFYKLKFTKIVTGKY